MRITQNFLNPRAARALFLGALAIAALSAACKKSGGGDEDEAASKENAAPAQVTLTTVTRGDISKTLLINGPVAALPNRDVKISSLVPGRVAQLDVAEGDRVTAGQTVAKIDDHSFRDQVTQAEAASQQAAANLQNSKLNLTRNEDLVNRGIAARKDLEDARTEQSVNEAAQRQADAALSVARLQLSRTTIASPISGTVVKRSVSMGEQVDGTAATPIVEVAQLDEVELDANIPAAVMPHLKTGQAVPLTSDALPGRKFTGHIVAISQAVDPTSNAGLVRIRIPNGTGELRLGMFLGAQIPVETHKNALTVPSQAIYRDENNQPRVFTVSGDAATAVPVTLGIETPDTDEISGGVSEGQSIILTGGYGLEDKAKVTTAASGSEKSESDDDSKKGGDEKGSDAKKDDDKKAGDQKSAPAKPDATKSQPAKKDSTAKPPKQP